MSHAIPTRPPHERFNNLCPTDSLERFDYFELVACRVETRDDCVVQCGAAEAEFWAIYGRVSVGTGSHTMCQATAVHDADTPMDAVRIARQIAIETGKGFIAGDASLGAFPRRTGVGVSPVTDFAAIADHLTRAIADDLDLGNDGTPPGGDALDSHPLAELRNAFVAVSDFEGTDSFDPYGDATAGTSFHG